MGWRQRTDDWESEIAVVSRSTRPTMTEKAPARALRARLEGDSCDPAPVGQPLGGLWRPRERSSLWRFTPTASGRRAAGHPSALRPEVRRKPDARDPGRCRQRGLLPTLIEEVRGPGLHGDRPHHRLQVGGRVEVAVHWT